MPVMPSHQFPGEAHTPICGDCNVAMCWDISDAQYRDERPFWDNWRCRDCNPDYRGALQRWRAANLPRERPSRD